jgi:hypothetical protein
MTVITGASDGRFPQPRRLSGSLYLQLPQRRFREFRPLFGWLNQRRLPKRRCRRFLQLRRSSYQRIFP